MRKTLAACIFMHCLASATATERMPAADRPEAERHLVANWRAEKMIEAAARTGDIEEFHRQELVLAREVGGTPAGAVDRGSKDCVAATGFLMNVATHLRNAASSSMTADRLIGLRYNYRNWRERLAKCEDALGHKGQQILVLKLDR